MRNVGRVLIVGAGVGGLAMATALAQRGVEADVVEIKPDDSVLGVGINLPANALRALDAIGVLEQVIDVGFRYDTQLFYDWQGGFVVECPSRLGGPGIPANNALARPDLARILVGAATRAGATISHQVTVAELASEPGRVRAVLTDGRAGDYDLVVSFDGINSPSRRRLFGTAHEPSFTGYAIWRVLVPRRPDIRCACLYQGPGNRAGFIPLNGTTMYLLSVTREPGRPHHDPARFHQVLSERLAGYGGPVGEVRDAIRGPEGIVYTPLDEVRLPPPWHSGRVIVLGDAAHASAPHLTQGAAMALEDAVVLAEVLGRGDPVEQALDALTQRRLPRVGLVQDVSRGIVRSDMATTLQTLPGYLAHMKTELPGQLAGVETILNQPA